jgi:hypothetical protein
MGRLRLFPLLLLLASVACGGRRAEMMPTGSAAGTDAGAAGTPAADGGRAGTRPLVGGGAGGASAGAAGQAGRAVPAVAGAAGVPTMAAGASAGGAPMTEPPARLVTFRNGGFWNDAGGKRIEAHGGGFLHAGDTWYWFGEDKSANGAGFKAVNCYASADLSSWTFKRAIITRATTPELAASDRIIERPKVIYNESTKQYVMWLHWEGQNYAEAKAGVFTSSTVDGGYHYESAFRPKDNMSRDDTLFRDDDGKAYFLSAANENADLILYELTPDYLSIARQISVLFKGASREAPAMFKDADRYYLISSAATGWDPNQAKYATATSIEGPWSALQNLGDATTFDTQPAYVIPVHGTRATTYIYAADRWQDPDLGSSKYIWLPLLLKGNGQLALDYHPEWQLDLSTGEWRVDDGFIPQTDWKLVRADSEETSAENGRASNAFDGSASTIWHTQYTGATPAPPHEIVIDLGATYMLESLRYLPRQDSVDHGIVAAYEFYVSDAADKWEQPVATGMFAADREAKLVRFNARAGRYVRFVAMREINGREWASVAELDLGGVKQ